LKVVIKQRNDDQIIRIVTNIIIFIVMINYQEDYKSKEHIVSIRAVNSDDTLNLFPADRTSIFF
jgi:hypothetical protein